MRSIDIVTDELLESTLTLAISAALYLNLLDFESMAIPELSKYCSNGPIKMFIGI